MNIEKAILNRIQSTPENLVTNTIIIPLLREMGYKKVEFYGGASENGKDIIIWDEDAFGDVVLRVAQVKHFKFNAKAAGSNSFQTIVNQLSRCILNKIPYSNLTAYFPLEVLLISTHEIETKILQSKFDAEPALTSTKIKIIDGLRLSQLIQKYLPDIANEILGLRHELSIKMKPQFSNAVLLKALRRTNKKDIKQIYTDIDFSVGRFSTKILFCSDYKPRNQEVKIQVSDWDNFEEICNKISNLFPLDFFDQSFPEIKEKTATYVDEFRVKSAAAKLIEEEMKQKLQKISQLQKEYNVVKASLDRIVERRKDHVLTWTKEEGHKERPTKKGFKSLSSQFNKNNEVALQLTWTIKNLQTEIDSLRAKINEINFHCEKLVFNVTINGKTIARHLKTKRQWVEKQIAEINSMGQVNQGKLKDFILGCHTLFATASIFFEPKNEKYFACIGFELKPNTKRIAATRIKLPIEEIFNTGLSVTVLGEAGAGKSTSLEMYASKFENGEKTILLFPLGQLVQDEKQITHETLETLLLYFLNRNGVKLTPTEFTNFRKSTDCVFLLDGLDEAIKTLPSLPSLIKEFDKVNSNTQIIITSRALGDYIGDIPFFTVTLLPFTPEQRDQFIERWFKDNDSRSEFVEGIKKHIAVNSELGEIVKTPLLTTMLCVLAENKLNLPRTEIKLYDERLHLLTGYYDNVKHINTRINSSPKLLELVAQKIAFSLHSINKREESLDIIRKIAVDNLRNQYSEIEIDTALNELIRPCELLVPMNSLGKYGLGHLRYQEHLTARELLTNRSIDLIPLLSQEWWFGSILLFARMQENIEWFIKEVGEKRKYRLQIIDLIIKTRNKVERNKLEALILRYKYLNELEND